MSPCLHAGVCTCQHPINRLQQKKNCKKGPSFIAASEACKTVQGVQLSDLVATASQSVHAHLSPESQALTFSGLCLSFPPQFVTLAFRSHSFGLSLLFHRRTAVGGAAPPEVLLIGVSYEKRCFLYFMVLSRSLDAPHLTSFSRYFRRLNSSLHSWRRLELKISRFL